MTNTSGQPSDPVSDRQIADLTAIVEALTDRLTAQELRHRQLVQALRRQITNPAAQEPVEEDRPAVWVLLAPPAADTGPDEVIEVIESWVHWYNRTYVGIDGGRAKPIPACWREHPGLAMEIGTLCQTWRQANLGPDATAREAELWHHQWRPGFADRLARDWVHPDCFDGGHPTPTTRQTATSSPPAASPTPP